MTNKSMGKMEKAIKFQVRKDESKTLWCGTRVYRIYAAKEFTTTVGTCVKPGSRGGWVESEKNLSQDGVCWIADEACVYGNALVRDNALVSNNASVFGNAIVRESAVVYDDAAIYGDSEVCGVAHVFEHARVCGKVSLSSGEDVRGTTVVDRDVLLDVDNFSIDKPFFDVESGHDSNYVQDRVIFGGCGFKPVQSGDKDDSKG